MNTPRSYHWESKKILIVEDDESSSYLLGVILEETGAGIAFVRNGNDAVEYIRENPDTDLILMDIQLPGLDGFTASRNIKSFAENVVIIAQTAYAITIDRNLAREAGCEGFLTKPVNPEELLEVLSGFVS